MNDLIKPPKLNFGDTIAAITLSWGGASLFKYRYEIGIARLKEHFNLTVLPTKHALSGADWIASNPKARADDLMEAFSNPQIKGIFSIIGGDDLIKLLPYIDYDLIRSNPKIFMGYSDSTVAHFMCLKSGLSSFYGPSILKECAENVRMFSYTKESMHNTLFSNRAIGKISPSTGWTAEYLDWAEPQNQDILRPLDHTTHWKFINGSGKTTGRLIGGCVETLEKIMNTEIWPELATWHDTILFIETSEAGNSPHYLKEFLCKLGEKQILSVINGILFGRPGGPIASHTFSDYDNIIQEVLAEYNQANLPVITQMDFGHTDPMMILPYGRIAQIDSSNQQFSIIENAVV